MESNLQHLLPEPNVSILDRRKEYRLNIRVPVTIAGVHPQTLEDFKVETSTQNVSRYGACFEMDRGLARVGSLMDLAMGNRFEAKCRVIWMKETDDGRDTLGVEFVSVTGQWVLYN